MRMKNYLKRIGCIALSVIMTLSVPNGISAADEAEPVNVALRANNPNVVITQTIQSASPDFDDRNARLVHLNDGQTADPGKHWDGGYEPASFTMDLGSYYDIREFRFYPYHHSTLEYSQRYTIEVSRDGVNYTLAAQKNDDTLASAQPQVYPVSDTVARYVRVTCITGGGAPNFVRCHVHVVEFEVYALPDPAEVEAELTMVRPSVLIPIGLEASLPVKAVDKFGRQVADPTIEWSASTEGIVEVNNGGITGKAKGKTVLTATWTETGKTATCEVEVYDYTVQSARQNLALGKSTTAPKITDDNTDKDNYEYFGIIQHGWGTTTIDLGKVYGLTEFVVYPRYYEPAADPQNSVNCWYQYEVWCGEYENDLVKVAEKKNERISTKDGDFYGLEKPVRAQFVQIRITASSRENPTFKEFDDAHLCEVKVYGFDGKTPVEPKTTINRKNLKVALGSTYEFSVKSLDIWGDLITDGNSWSTDSPAIAGIDRATGVMTAKQEGTATITVTNTITSATDSCTVEVYDPETVDGKILNENVALKKPLIKSISLFEGRLSNLTDGDKENLCAVIQESETVIDLKEVYDLKNLVVFGDTKNNKANSYEIYTSPDDIAYEFAFRNTDEADTADGKEYIFEKFRTARYIKVKLNGNGEAAVSALKELEAYADVYTEPVEAYIKVDKNAIVLKPGRTTTLTVEAQDEWKQAVTDLTFTSADTTIATVDATGKVTAVAPGTTQIEVSSAKLSKSVSVKTEVYNPETTNSVVTSVNVALNKNVTTSSGPLDGSSVCITDGDGYTFSAIGGTYEFIIHLENEYDLQKVRIFTYYGQDRTYLYDIFTSLNGTNFDKAFTNTDEVDSANGKEYVFDQPKKAKYIKVVMNGNTSPEGANILSGLYEVEAYADVETDAVEPKIEVNKESLTMPVGRNTKLIPTAWDEWKHEEKGFTFTSGNEGIAKVDSNGNVTSVAEGNTYIEITSDVLNISIKVPVTVYDMDKEQDEIKIAVFWPPTPEYVNEEQYNYIKEANFNRVFGSFNADLRNFSMAKKIAKLCADRGMDFIAGEGALAGPDIENEDAKTAVERYQYLSGIGGFYMVDEPIAPAAFAKTYKQIVKLWSEAYPHINMFPNVSNIYPGNAYQEALDAYGTAVGDDLQYIMFDRYPFGATAGSFDANGMFDNLNIVRKAALKYNAKPACYMQSIGKPGGFRKPSASEIEYNAAIALAYGYKQLAYFTYFQPLGQAETFTTAIMDGYGNKTEIYDPVKEVNRQVMVLSPTLINLDAKEVYHHGSLDGQQAVPADFLAQVEGNSNVLISYMVDKTTGKEYIMVVNKDFTNPQNITLNFADTVESVREISKLDGSYATIVLDTANKSTLSFKAGEGKLIAINPHIHAYSNEWRKDDTKHWKECECGTKTQEAAHTYDIEKSNETHHWTECICGAKTQEVENEDTTELKKQLAEAIAEADKILENPDIVNSWKAWKAFADALESARNVSADNSATGEMISSAIAGLDAAKKKLIDINKVWAHSLTLDGTIGVNYYATLDAATRSNPDAYVEFTIEDGKKTRIPVKEAVEAGTKKVTKDGIGYDCYRFTVKVIAKQMANTITAKLFANEKDTNPVNLGDYAVRDYLTAVASSDDEALKSLVNKMVNYGAYAQQYFKYRTDDLAKPVEDVSTVTIPDTQQMSKEEKATDKIAYRSSNLLLEADTELRINFDIKDPGLDVSKLSAVGGEIVKVSNTRYYVRIPNIKAKELDKMQNVIVSYDGVEQFRIHESVVSYMYRAVNKIPDESLKNLLKSLYQYHLEAKKYLPIS